LVESEQDRTTSGDKKSKDLDKNKATGTLGLTKAEETEQRRLADIYLSLLQKRILQVLKDHTFWICARAVCSRLGFDPRHWPDGRRIYNLEWLSPPSLVDTPLQLLKVLCYDNLMKHSQSPLWRRRHYIRTWELACIRKRLTAKARSWTHKIHHINERDTYAFYDDKVPRNSWYIND